jgi:hypothetical protein
MGQLRKTTSPSNTLVGGVGVKWVFEGGWGWRGEGGEGGRYAELGRKSRWVREEGWWKKVCRMGRRETEMGIGGRETEPCGRRR